MRKLVVDSSVIVKWLSEERELDVDKADKLLTAALEKEIELIAPELALYEVGNVLIKRKFSIPQAITSFSTLHSLPLTFVTESENLAVDTFTISSQLGITYYDASFLSVAKKFKAILITENVKHQGKTNQVKVIALKDY